MIETYNKELKYRLQQKMIYNGEIGTIEEHSDIIWEMEFDFGIEFPDNTILGCFREAAEGFVDDMQDNAMETELTDYFTETDRQDRIEYYESMRPSVIRKKHLKTLTT